MSMRGLKAETVAALVAMLIVAPLAPVWLAHAGPPRTVPLAPARPPDANPDPAPGPPPAAPSDEPPAAEILPEASARASALPSTSPLPPARPGDRPAAPEPSGDVAACRERLRGLGVRFEVLPPIREGACGAPFPVRVVGLAGGLDLVPASIVTCPVAEAVARWAGDSLVPEAGRLLGRTPRRLRIGGAYECRGRNRVVGAKLSEHAFANAIDLMGIEFERGPPFTVTFQRAGSPEERFQAAIRSAACARFNTVLGPGSDASHTDHLHVDLRARRGRAFCQ